MDVSETNKHKAASAGHYHTPYSRHDSADKLLNRLNSLSEEPVSTLSRLATQISEAVTREPDICFSAVLVKPKDLDKQLILAGYNSTVVLHSDRPLRLSYASPWLHQVEESKLLDVSKLDLKDFAKHISWPSHRIETGIEALDLKSLYIVKLKARGNITGLLVVGLSKKLNPDANVIKTINSAKGVIAVLIDSLMTEQVNHRILRRIKESEAKLVALDEAKDDFISMASHQLRTPLTSVKGYISMILEGDAGAITPEEETMLSQAFASCQRMVYIISDLLNVSRLRTGKFVIDRNPINLDLIVRDEIDQLKEIAKSRAVSINYTPPSSFPDLMLDETKTRQVIMNFIDNALYYTPSGGKITVEVSNRESAVELRVKDNGIGVPKSEQHHLFTKFYRATNARKTRPDGTGLGLFMAKKIVIAEGGAMVFESSEGKGSTFGFIFPKTPDLTPKQ